MTQAPHTVTSRIARSTGVLVMATALSRILGFVLSVVMARLFGTRTEAQAFVVAFRLPNLFRDLVAEGAMASAVVPVLSRYRSRGDDQDFWQLSQTVFTHLVLLLVLLGAAGVVAAPLIVHLVAPGFAVDSEKYALTVQLTRVLFPFLTLVGLWAYFMGLLNTLHHFALPALGPAIQNVAMLAACAWGVPQMSPGILALAIGVLVGGLIQAVLPIPEAVRRGFRWRWRWTHPGSWEIARLLGPRLVGSAVYQANVLIDTTLASFSTVVGEGAVAAIFFANRFVQLPLALFGTAAAQASLPSLAEHAEDRQVFSGILLSVLRMVGFIILPSAVGLAVLAYPIVHGLIEGGAFDASATRMTSQALTFYALGLWAFATNKVLTGAFYALRDTKTPVWLAAETVAVNLLLCLWLMRPLQVGGLALAAALSNTANAFRLLRRMERRLERPLMQPLAGPWLRMTVAALLMGAGCWLLWTLSGWERHPWIGLPLVIAAGAAVYAVVCRCLNVEELRVVWRWLRTLPGIQLFAGE